MQTGYSNCDEERILQAVLREDFYSFCQKAYEITYGSKLLINWHLELLSLWMTKAANRQTRRMIINLPPRSLKSFCVSVVLPAWLLGHNPTTKIICASYSQSLAEKLAADCKRLMESDYYKKLFPKCAISKNKNTQQEFATTAGGFRLTTSIEGTLTGRGGDYIIIDDPNKPDDALSDSIRKSVNDWMSNTVFSRLDDKNKGVIIVCMQRVHQNDLTGYLMEMGDWEILTIPIIADCTGKYYMSYPPDEAKVKLYNEGEVLHSQRESLDIIIEIRKHMGEYNFQAQYIQNPQPASGNLIKREWLNYHDKLPDGEPKRIIQSWDTASKASDYNDYSVCTTWHQYNDGYYLVNVLRRKLEFPDLKKMIISHAISYNASAVLIEDKASGIQLIQDLQRETILPIIACAAEQDKKTRMLCQTPKIEAGNLFIPRVAPWLADFENEILSFPASKYDDQVDSMSQALKYMSEYKEIFFGFL